MYAWTALLAALVMTWRPSAERLLRDASALVLSIVETLSLIAETLSREFVTLVARLSSLLAFLAI